MSIKIENSSKHFEKFIETISPLMISANSNSFKVSLSKRFFLNKLIENTFKALEKDHYLNFISVLKFNKFLGRFIYDTLENIYKDRNSLFFKNFFIDKDLYMAVKDSISDVYKTHRNKGIKLTITKRGIIIYDNYKPNEFNILLLTIHSGHWVDQKIRKKLNLTSKERYFQEDLGTDLVYKNLVLDKAGIWIDTKQSRFVCDLNRNKENSICREGTITWKTKVWKESLTKKEVKEIEQFFLEFYFTLDKILETHQFNIIFDGHSMRNEPGRPDISFGTKYIPKFYMPIVKSMQRRLIKIGYKNVKFNTPFKGGYILRWLQEKHPNVFIFSMELNMGLYTTKSYDRVYKGRSDKLSNAIFDIFNIEKEDYDDLEILGQDPIKHIEDIQSEDSSNDSNSEKITNDNKKEI